MLSYQKPKNLETQQGVNKAMVAGRVKEAMSGLGGNGEEAS